MRQRNAQHSCATEEKQDEQTGKRKVAFIDFANGVDETLKEQASCSIPSVQECGAMIRLNSTGTWHHFLEFCLEAFIYPVSLRGFRVLIFSGSSADRHEGPEAFHTPRGTAGDCCGTPPTSRIAYLCRFEVGDCSSL